MRLPERPVHQADGARPDRAAPRILRSTPRPSRACLTALDALTIAPEVFKIEAGVYLGLRSIYWQLTRAKSDDSLRDVVAPAVGDGRADRGRQYFRRRSAPCAPRRRALRQALERGASDEEIKKLTDELRAALDKFLQALGRGDEEESADGAADAIRIRGMLRLAGSARA